MRVTLALSSVEVSTLQGLAARRGISVADVLARAISHEMWLSDVDEAGGNVFVLDRNGGLHQAMPRAAKP